MKTRRISTTEQGLVRLPDPPPPDWLGTYTPRSYIEARMLTFDEKAALRKSASDFSKHALAEFSKSQDKSKAESDK